jgi:6-phosphofructokinase 1
MKLAILTAGAPTPGMNTAVRAATRLALDRGHTVLAVHNGFEGLARGEFEEFGWMSVSGWGPQGGSLLGTSRRVPTGADLYAVARQLESHGIEGLMIIGGWAAYEAALKLYNERAQFPSFDIPTIGVPATIDNNLPNSELSIGADTALNSIVEAIDKIKQSAVAARRCFVVEVMGRYCGYLALMSGLATGAEQVYMHEEGVRIKDLYADLLKMIEGFQAGKRLSLVIRNEQANPLYTTDFMCALFEEEGKKLFDVRPAILGHLQQGGDPSPFDRIQATRLARLGVEFLSEKGELHANTSAFIGLVGGHVKFTNIEDMPRLADTAFMRPKEQWWLSLRSIGDELAQAGSSPANIV